MEKEKTIRSEERAIAAGVGAILLAATVLLGFACFLLPSTSRREQVATVSTSPGLSGSREPPRVKMSSMLQPATGKQAIRVKVALDGSLGMRPWPDSRIDLFTSVLDPANAQRRVLQVVLENIRVLGYEGKTLGELTLEVTEAEAAKVKALGQDTMFAPSLRRPGE
ncbi:hypothetical protein AYO44_04660 [Planctomycetaceae bacterium SCGC AG-212-F19]|nr:hypothetical protein AYO44_04660 [Planctomycetaceae bacterium SCGC AG-212-F19]